MAALRSPPCSQSPSTKAARYVRNCTFRRGFDEGESRFRPSLSTREKFTCLPLPFRLAKGFSWRSSLSPCLWASRRMVSIITWFWSHARLASQCWGANSN